MLANRTPIKNKFIIKKKKKWAKDMKRNLTEEDIDMANKHMRKFSASPAIREIQIETTRRYHLTPVRNFQINKAGNNKY